MPKDSHLLPPWSQALLRAARMGQVFRPPAPPVEEDKEPGEDEDADGDIDHGFVATKWGLVPRHLEGPEPEFLAKRRKGLSSLYGAVSGAIGASNQMRKTKIKKTDSEGHEYVLEALVPEGQTVEGEVAAGETSLSEAPAPGTVVEGVGIVNADGVVIAAEQIQPTPPRRKPPPPKRKAKGPGRGRKKKVAFAPGPNGAPPSRDLNDPSSATVNGQGTAVAHGGTDQPAGDGDVEMGDDSLLQDGEEGSEEEDEGEEGEDGDREDGELSPSPRPASASPLKQPIELEPEPKQEQLPVEPELKVPEVQSKRDPSSSPDLPLAAGQSLHPPIIHVQPTVNTEVAQPLPVEPSEAPEAIPFEEGPVEAIPHIEESVAVETISELSEPAPVEAIARTGEFFPAEAIPQIAEPVPVEAVAQIEEPFQAETIPQIAEPAPVEAIPQTAEPIPVEAIPQIAEPAPVEVIPHTAEPVPVEAIPELAESILVDEPQEPMLLDDPQVTAPAIEAELPPEHNPLDGLAEPVIATNEEVGDDLHFPDGEEDLLGSLERHLEKRGS